MSKFFLILPTQFSWHNLLVLLTVVTEVTVCLEEPHPEIFLQPRNFNPHPYEVSARREERNGPVVFPPNPEDNLVEDRSRFVTLRNFPLRETHPIDNHPYAKVARKHKYRVISRFDDQGSQSSAHIRKALGKHAAQVLSYPPEQLAKHKVPSQLEGKDYAFSYKVLDHLGGDDFSHSQTRNSKATNGEYRVKLPDGRVQIVSYTADKNGYKADVKYTEDEAVADRRLAPHQDQSVQIQRIPVRALYPLEEERFSDYHSDIHPPNRNIVVLQAVVPTPIPGNYNGHVDIAVTPSPAYLNAAESRDLQRQPYPKVEIYTTNARDYITGSYIPSTVSPYFAKIVSNPQRRVISPEVSNNGNHGLSAPTTASSFVLTDHQGQVLDNIKLVAATNSPLVVQNHVTSTTTSPIVLGNLFSTSLSRF